MLPEPQGPLAIDAKFPLEPYEAMVSLGRAPGKSKERADAERKFRAAIKTHIKAISEKYILPGETAPGALMFLPAEAIYAELHARFPDLVREAVGANVWIVSPTTAMATLTTLAAVLRDARVQAHAQDIRREIGLLGLEIERIAARTEGLEKHLLKATEEAAALSRASARAKKRGIRLDTLDFDGPPQALAGE